MARLGELCALNMGQSPDSSSYNETGDGLPFFQGNADFGLLHPTVRVWCNSPTKIVHPGDILISVRAPIGALNIADKNCCIGRGLAALTVNEDLCSKEYIWYAIANKVEELNSKGTGSTFKAISKNVLSETEIPLPPLNEQYHIANELDKVSSLIFLRKQQLAKLDELVKARFMEIFGDVARNPYGFPYISFEEISQELFAGGDKPADISLVQTEEYLYPVYANGETDLGLQGYSKNYRVNQAAITVSARGTIGFCCIRAPFFTPVVRLITLIPKEAGNLIYIKQAIELADLKSSGTSQGQLTVPDFKKTEIILPPIEYQEQFATFAARVDRQKLTIQQSLDKLEVLKKSLMQEYFG